MEATLSGQVALITGAGKGIGRAVALELSGRGAGAVLVDKDAESAAAVAEAIQDRGGAALVVACDLRIEDEVTEAVRQALGFRDHVDILVNNAGIGTVAPLWETPTAAWDDIMAVNLRGAYLCAKCVVPHMLERRAGRIVNMASAVGRQAQPLISAYGVSKAGMIAMTVALAKEVADRGITVNAVCPGPVATPWWDEPRKALAGALGVAEGDVVDWFTRNKQVIKEAIVPEDVARVVAWLVGDDARLITGQAIPIDGGHEFPTF